MKKLFVYFAILPLLGILISCSNDDDNSITLSIEGDPKPLKIEITSNGEEVEGVYNDGVIVLQTGQAYHIELTFKNPVVLHPGAFLKFKKENEHKYSADFYGRNRKSIEEIVKFVAGKNEWQLRIVQDKLTPNHFISIQGSDENDWGSNFGDSPYQIINHTAILLTTPSNSPYDWDNMNDENFTRKLEVTFPVPAYIDAEIKDGDYTVLEAKVNPSDPNKHILTIHTKPFQEKKDYELKIPIYEFINNEKGEKAGEITIKSNLSPYLEKKNIWYDQYGTMLNQIQINEGASELENVEFRIQGTKSIAFIENLNKQYFKNATASENGMSWNIEINREAMYTGTTLKDVHAFDVYQGELKDGKVIKKADSPKRTITFSTK